MPERNPAGGQGGDPNPWIIFILLVVMGLLWLASFAVFHALETTKTPQLPPYPTLILSGCVVAMVVISTLLLLRERETERRHRVELEGYARKLHDAYGATLQALTSALDLRDSETWGHSQRVLGYSLAAGRRTGMAAADLHSLAWGALLHDVGKIGVADHILQKPGPLSLDERRRMNDHVEIGYRLIAPIAVLQPALDVVRYHHEVYDGSGYPHGLAGTAIPLVARVFSVADAFDAMTSSRPYRGVPLTFADARAELRRMAGRQFCPAAVETFCSLSDDELRTIQVQSYSPITDFRQLLFDHTQSQDLQYDRLTGAFSRNSWELVRMQMMQRHGPDLGSIIFIDVDGLKGANDEYGHQTGDAVIADAARRLISVVRPEGTVYRYGGDEFLIWTPPGISCDTICSRIRPAAAAFAHHWGSVGPQVDLSMGCSVADRTTQTVDDLIQAADAQMYVAKRMAKVRSRKERASRSN